MKYLFEQLFAKYNNSDALKYFIILMYLYFLCTKYIIPNNHSFIHLLNIIIN